MGIIITKLRKKKTTEEVLEKLDKEIKAIESYRINTEQTQKRIFRTFICISITVYSLAAFLFYFYFFPSTFYDALFYILSLICTPFALMFMSRSIRWYYRRKISLNQTKLQKLNDEKKKILDNVMETEIYKKAKTILEKYAPEQIRKNSFPVPSSDATPIRNNSVTTVAPTTGLRYRGVPSTQPSQMFRTPYSGFQTPFSRPPATTASQTVTRISTTSLGVTPSVSMQVNLPGTPLPLPRMVLPRDRTVFDRMVEYLVGDGPSNRYALICKQCSSHNGMALKEEFEYISFRCCYCYVFNPARKKRPPAPRLEIDIKPQLSLEAPDSSESEKNSSSDTDSDQGVKTLTSQFPKNLETLFPKEKEPSGSDSEKNDFDKLSDAEFKISDNEATPMEVDNVSSLEERKEENITSDGNSEVKSDVIDEHKQEESLS